MKWAMYWQIMYITWTVQSILGDPAADSGGEGQSKRAEKYGKKGK